MCAPKPGHCLCLDSTIVDACITASEIIRLFRPRYSTRCFSATAYTHTGFSNSTTRGSAESCQMFVRALRWPFLFAQRILNDSIVGSAQHKQSLESLTSGVKQRKYRRIRASCRGFLLWRSCPLWPLIVVGMNFDGWCSLVRAPPRVVRGQRGVLGRRIAEADRNSLGTGRFQLGR